MGMRQHLFEKATITLASSVSSPFSASSIFIPFSIAHASSITQNGRLAGKWTYSDDLEYYLSSIICNVLVVNLVGVRCCKLRNKPSVSNERPQEKKKVLPGFELGSQDSKS